MHDYQPWSRQHDHPRRASVGRPQGRDRGDWQGGERGRAASKVGVRAVRSKCGDGQSCRRHSQLRSCDLSACCPIELCALHGRTTAGRPRERWCRMSIRGREASSPRSCSLMFITFQRRLWFQGARIPRRTLVCHCAMSLQTCCDPVATQTSMAAAEPAW